MSEREFSQQLVLWTDDFVNIRRWFFVISTKKDRTKKILDAYEHIKTMWFEHRSLFPNKGTYKTVRRLFVKIAQNLLSVDSSNWEKLPADLCKEILHKADQGWISYQYEIPNNFCDYLKWKSAQAGYICSDYKRPCFVNDDLKAVYRIEEATGIARWHQNKYKVEVMLFSPLYYYKNSSRISALIGCHDWENCYYPNYEVSFPTPEACHLFNLYAPQKARNCHLEAIPANKELFAPELPLVLIDNDDVEPASCTTIAENLYVSVYLTLEQFKKINPNIGFPQIYLMD